MFSELQQDASQLVMCGVWLHIMHYVDKDLASYFVSDCNTFVAPKPDKIDSATLIYLTLSTPVWVSYLFCFVLTVVALTVISKVEERITGMKVFTSNFGRCMLEATNTATSHGIVNFPTQSSIKILLIR